MIVYDLICDQGHPFEGWFSSSADYQQQFDGGLLACPHCGSVHISKAPMAPAVAAKGNQKPAISEPPTPALSNAKMPDKVKEAMTALAKAQSEALKNSTWVGDKFAEQSRAMHYGERDEAVIHGKATMEEAKELADEGIGIAPLPFPVAEPDEVN